MIITDKFVFIHFPKSGGTFIANNIERLYKNQLIPNYQKKGFLHKWTHSSPFFTDFRENPFFDNILEERHNHNGICLLPQKYHHLPVFTSIRIPYDFYVSYFETNKWVTKQTLNNPEIQERFPNFPQLNFTQFLDFIDLYYTQQVYRKITGQQPIHRIGLYSLLVILLYSDQPLKDFSLLKEKETSNYNLEDFHLHRGIHFIDFQQLTAQFHEYMNHFFTEKFTQFIDKQPKENISPHRISLRWEDYFSDMMQENILRKDQLGFLFFESMLNKTSKL